MRTVKKPVYTLILVADAAHARYFLHEGPGCGLKALPARDVSEPHKANRDLDADKPGRAFESATHGRSAYEPKRDSHALAEAAFLRRLAEGLPDIMKEEEAERLIVCADPKALGLLRGLLPTFAAERLAATLDKDLVKTPAKELAKHLEDLLAM
ncbi:MAG: host attachment protein [Phyllobacteriaceae bacterium]|nr:host attachment protein [Phyllobacteriaceae bacterium]